MPRSPQDDKVVCLTCGCANYPRAHFCIECDAPLSAHAVNDPFDTIKSTGWAYRRAQQSPRSLVIVVGIWLLFLPLAIICAVELLTTLPHAVAELRGAKDRGLFLGFLLLMIAGLYISSTIIRRTTVGYLQERNRRRLEAVAGEDDDDLTDGAEEDGGEFDDDFEDDEDDDGSSRRRKR